MTPSRLRPSDRVAIVGKTGSGKTYAAHLLTADIRRLVVIDTKGTLGSWSLPTTAEDWRTALDEGTAFRYRWRPPLPSPYLRGKDLREWEDNVLEPAYTELFVRLYHAGSLTLYIDEMYGVVPPGRRPDPWLLALYTRGRELGIGVWAAAQRPASVPVVMFTEADWFLMFRLQRYEDQKRMAEYIGDQALQPLYGHSFLLYNAEWDRPREYPSIVVRQR